MSTSKDRLKKVSHACRPPPSHLISIGFPVSRDIKSIPLQQYCCRITVHLIYLLQCNSNSTCHRIFLGKRVVPFGDPLRLFRAYISAVYPARPEHPFFALFFSSMLKSPACSGSLTIIIDWHARDWSHICTTRRLIYTTNSVIC